jgi:hypothetical protein
VLQSRYEKNKNRPSQQLVLKQQTEGAAIKTESAVLGAGGYIYIERER